MRILHIITNLGQGGAEAVLYRLITVSPPDIEHVVVSLMDDSYYGTRLRAAGIRVYTLDSPRGWVTLSGVLKLRQIISSLAPDVVQTWMYHADLVGGLIARLAGVRTVVWGIRHSNLAADKTSFSARTAAWFCARLSSWVPAAIVCCSEQATRVHQAIGYEAAKFTVIPNGYDLGCFSPNNEARARLRAEWRIADNEILLGLVARWDPQKDHENLLKALALLKANGTNFRCILVGTEMNSSNITLTDLIQSLALQDRVMLLGSRDDIPAVMNALDLHVLSSVGEAFPNTVAEAMACGTPCVVTDVGDAALIVGDTGWVVPAQDDVALAHGIEDALTSLLAKGRASLGSACRWRIEQNFGIDKMINRYFMLWKECK